MTEERRNNENGESPVSLPVGLSRRRFLKRVGVVGGLAMAGGTLSTLLTACGGSSSTSTAASNAATTSTAAASTATTAGSTATQSSGGSSATPSSASTAASTATTASSSTAPAGKVTRGGTLTWAYTSSPQKLDPIWSQALVDETVMVPMIEAPARANRDGSGVEPAIAQKWDVSTDGLTYTLNLRPNVKFHDGTTVTSADVVASLQRNKAMGSYMWQLQDATSIEAVDDSTVKIVLGVKIASMLARLAVPANGVFPASEIQKIGKNEFTAPIGTGPFKLKEWVRNDHFTMAANPDYWDMAPDGKPYPYVDQVIIKQVAEVTTQVLQVQAGQLDGGSAPYSQVKTLQNDSKGQLISAPQQQVYFMVVQTTKPPFDDVKVRQAMSLALDRKVLVDQATAGTATVANSFFPKGTLDWDPDLTLPFDVAKAKQLIAQSKYPQGHKGAKLQYPSGAQIGHDNAVLCQQMWQAIGIDLTIEEVESSTLGNNWYASNYESISGYQWTNGMADPDQLVQFFFITPRMNSGYEPSKAAQDLVTQASQELDPAKRKQIYYQLQQIYNTDVGGTIDLYYTTNIAYISKNVQGYYRSPLGFPYWWEFWRSK
ncbi:MAG TPA: ABC transporter substrate-binding protein [Nitrolancea sp.]|nr:ABC transporter substrate-binding protein [Nitrolancea sp.]